MPRIPLTNEIRNELKALHEKTNIGPQRLLKGKPDRPRGLNSTTIYQWMDGTRDTAKSEHLDWVLHEWRQSRSLVPFTQADISLLQAELYRTGYKASSLLRRLSPVPKGFTPDILHRLSSGRLKKIDKEHKDFLFENLAKLPSEK